MVRDDRAGGHEATSSRDRRPNTATSRKRPAGWVRIVRLVSGIALIAVGLLGLILPVMPGWVFVIPGLVLLSTVTPKVRLFLRAIRDRIPRRLGPIREFFHRLQALARSRRQTKK